MERLLQIIEAEARRRAEELRDEAEREAAAMVAAAQRDAPRERERVLEVETLRLQREKASRIAEVRAELERRKLAARERTLERVLERARELLIRQIDSERLTRVAQRQFELSLHAFGSRPEVHGPPDLLEALTSAHGGELDAVVKDDMDGFVAIGKDGSPRVEFHARGLVDRYEQWLAIGIVRDLEEAWEATGQT